MKRSYLDYAMSVIVSRALARRARRPQAGAAAHPLRHARRRLRFRPAAPQVGADRRRRDGQVPSARRFGDLRRAGPHGAGLQHAPAADRRAGQFRLDGRRSAGGDALHRIQARQGRRRAAGRHRQGHGRLPAELRREPRRAHRPPGAVPEPAGQRCRRHRRRHGHQHPAAQSGRDHRRHRGPDRRPRPRSRRPGRDRPGPGLPDRGHHPRPQRHPAGLPGGPRRHHHPLQDPFRGGARAARRSSSPRCPTRSTRPGWSSGSPRSTARRRSRASPTCATRATATACGW